MPMEQFAMTVSPWWFIAAGAIISLFGSYLAGVRVEYRAAAQKKNTETLLDKTTDIDSTTRDTNEMLLSEAAYKKLLISPDVIFLPSKVSRVIPIVITNNYPFPVSAANVVIEVESGDVDLTKDFIPPSGGGFWGAKRINFLTPIIPSGAIYSFNWSLNGSEKVNNSKIKLSVPEYFKGPMTDFTIHDMDSLPEHINLGEGFDSKPIKN